MSATRRRNSGRVVARGEAAPVEGPPEAAVSGDEWTELAATILRVGLLLCCLLPLVVSPGTIYPFNIGKSIFIRSLVDVLFPLWALLAFRVPEYRPRLGPVLAAALLVGGVTVVAALAGDNPERSMWSTYARSQGVVELLHFLAFAVMAACMFRPDHWRLSLLWTSLGVNAVIMGAGILVYYLWPTMPFLDGDKRLHGTMGQPTFLAAYCTFSMVVGMMAWSRLGCWWRPGRDALLASALALLALCNLWGIWLAAGRMSVLTLLALLAFSATAFAVLSPRPAVRALALSGIGALVVCSMALAALVYTSHFTVDADRIGPGEHLVNRLSRSFGELDNSSKGRLSAIRAGAHAYVDRPLLGWGPELFDRGWVRHITIEEHNGNIFDQSHNKLIEVAATTGTVGLLAYGALLAAIVAAFARLMLRTRRTELARSVFTAGLLVNYVVVSMFLFDTTSFMYAFAVLLVFALMADGDHPPNWAANWAAGRARLAPWRPRWRPLPHGGALVTAATVTALTVCAMVSLAFSLRIYSASAEQPLQGPWYPVLAGYVNSVHKFPAMANVRRVDYTMNLGTSLPLLSIEEKKRALPFFVQQMEQALEEDPGDWQVHYAAVVLYLSLKDERHDFPDRARWHRDRVSELAPHSFYRQEVSRIVEVYLDGGG